MWGLPLDTGRGDWPPLPHPPPWFMLRSLATASRLSKVVNRFPVSKTGRRRSSMRPLRITDASPADPVSAAGILDVEHPDDAGDAGLVG